jgi:hypothetical protein
LPEFEYEVQALPLIDLQGDRFPHGAFEPRDLDNDAITARLQQRRRKIPTLVGHYRHVLLRAEICHRYISARHYRAGVIGYRA